MVQATSSSHEQVIFIPPVHFSRLMLQRGTMHILPMAGDMVGMEGMGDDDMVPGALAIVERSNIIMDIDSLLCLGAGRATRELHFRADRHRVSALPPAKPVGNAFLSRCEVLPLVRVGSKFR